MNSIEVLRAGAEAGA